MIKGNILTDYLEACRTADLKTFKRDIRLNRIFEHASIEQGKAYLNHILRVNPVLLDNIFTNDLLGNPVVYNWGNGIYYSPSTLQYIAVLAELVKLCGSLDGLRIVEIGGGYGGQCKTVLDVFKIMLYHIIDLPEACELQLRYLANKPAHISIPNIIDQEYDLFVSNYALSEIKDNTAYTDIARRCKHGYITCNTDFVKLDWPHERKPDITNEENNYILIW